jgi:hypothetical protein
LLPPSTLKSGVLPVMVVKSATTQPTTESMLQSTWYAPICCASALALQRQGKPQHVVSLMQLCVEVHCGAKQQLFAGRTPSGTVYTTISSDTR